MILEGNGVVCRGTHPWGSQEPAETEHANLQLRGGVVAGETWASPASGGDAPARGRSPTGNEREAEAKGATGKHELCHYLYTIPTPTSSTVLVPQ